MSQRWKSAVYQYVRHHNRMEVEYTIEPLPDFVADKAYIRMQNNRLSRIAQAHKDRKLRPSQCQTRVKFLHLTERGDEAEVYLQLHKLHNYGPRHVEQKIEREKLNLREQNGRWLITAVSVDLSEKNEASRWVPEAKTPSPIPYVFPEAAGRTQPGPYLNQQILSSEPLPRPVKYDRWKAQQYAEAHWNRPNPAFVDMEVDCSNFVSQCLYAGGAPMNYTGRRDNGWWYKGLQQHQELWSYSWSVAQSLQAYLSSSKAGLRAQAVESPYQLAIGDVITYDWDGDSRYQHSVIVTAHAPDGAPLVNARTTDSRHRYWEYKDSYAWTERTKYKFFHISDYF
ncbi:amidase domain-containing protein [Ferviditalea candida]|uniref:Amidase domain-containing protein n=1 Tax=Ferviditalea candida TaxID=3108399 RepID=A0ABU5ZLV1_9BACL|nr:amidase domain-containing protein [Paenibacillaceae bacterium T2]